MGMRQVGGLRFGVVMGWLLLGLAGHAGAADSGLQLDDPPGTRDAVETVVGEPVTLSVIATRDGEPAAGEIVSWHLEDEDDGRLDAADTRSRAAGADAGIAAGSASARFTPTRAGTHGIRVEARVDPACRGDACRTIAHRIVVLARAADAPARGSDGRLLRNLGGGVVALGALATLTGGDGDPTPGDVLAIVSGNGQTGLANQPLGVPLEVDARSSGRIAAGATVNWTASGGATLSASSTVTGADGRTRVSVTSLGPGPGPVTVTATRPGASPAASVTFTLNIDVVALELVSGDNQTTPVNTTTAAPLIVRTRVNGVPQAGVAVQWQVVGGGTLSGVTATSDANGFAQAFFDAGPFPGTATVIATRVDAPAISQSFTVNVVETRDLQITAGDGQNAAQGNPVPAPLQVQALDGGLGDPGVTILWSASGGAVLSSTSTVTDPAGFTDVTVTDIGYDLSPVQVTATRADQPLLSVTFTLNVDPPSLAVVSGDAQSGLAGSAAPNPVQVLLLDGNGTPMAGQQVQWSVVSGSATLQSFVSTTDGAGLADVGFTFGTTPGPISIEASVFNGGATATATATSQPPAAMTAFSGDGQSGNPGDVLPIPLVVRINDPAPDLSGVPVTFTVVSGSASVSPASTVTDTNGDASTQVTLGLTPGPVVVQATAPGGVVVTFNLTVNGTLVVTGATASSGDGQQLVPGVPSAPMVIELIGNGSPLAGQTVTWTTTNGVLDAATTVTDANGITSNKVTVTGAGPTVVTASFPTYAAFVGTSVSFTHNTGLAALPSLAINEASVAEALDAACGVLGGGGPLSPDEQDLLDQCNALTAASTSDPAAVGAALTAMLPDVAQTQADAGRAAVTAQFDNVNARMVGLRSGAPVAQLSFQGLTLSMAGGRVSLGQLGSALLDVGATEPGDEAGAGFDRWGFFVSGNIGRGESDPTRLTPRYDFDVEGLTAGADYRYSDTLVLGAALGYTRQDSQLSGGQGAVDTEGFSLTAYSTWYVHGDWYLDSVLTLGKNRYDHRRRIFYTLPGMVVDQQATAASDGTEMSSTVTFGRDFQWRGFTLGTYGRAAYNRLSFDGFQETVDGGAGRGLALRIESRTVTGLSSTIGGKLAYPFSANWGVLLPQIEVEWVHDYKSDAEAFRGYFLDDPTGTPILVLGDDLDSDYFRVGLGLSMALSGGKSGFITYERLLARSGISQETLSLGFRWEF